MSGVQSISETEVSFAVRSALEAGASSAMQLLSSVGPALLEIWMEALLIAVALHLYYRFSPSSSSMLKRINHSLKTPKVLSAPVAADSEQELKNWIASVVGKGSKIEQDSLDRYETLVRSQHVHLRRLIADDQRARSFYLALIEGAVNLAVARDPPDGDTCSSAKPTISSLLADMRMYGFPKSHELYSSILKLLVASHLHADCLWLHDVIVADGVTLDRTMYINLLGPAVFCGLDQKAVFLFQEVSKTGLLPMRTYMTILKVYTKEQDWKSAVDLLDGLRRAKGSPDASVLNAVLRICACEGKIEVAHNLLEQWADSVDVVSCNIVLKGFAQHVDLPRSDRLLQRMVDMGPAPNIISFNTSMDCAARALAKTHAGEQPSLHSVDGARDRLAQSEALAQRLWHLLDQLLQLGLEADWYTCSTLVKGMHLTGCSAQAIDRAVSLVRRVGPAALHSAGPGVASTASGQVGNKRLVEVLFNTLLDTCASIQDLDRMVEIFGMMSSFNAEVSAVTFSTLIKAFGHAGQLGHCHELWQNMLDANVKPTIVTFGCYIDVCTRGLDMATAERVFHSMAAMSVKPNSVIYTSMIRGYASMKKPSKALELYRRMQAQGVQATAATFKFVLDILVQQVDDPARLQEVVEDMRASSTSPDSVTYSYLIKASCSAGRVDTAISLFRQQRQRGMAFDAASFNALLLACSKTDRVEVADELLGEVRSSGSAPTQATISILVKMYGKARMLDKAIEVSTMVEQQYGMKPNLHVFTCLIQACVRSRQTRQSWEVFGNMLRTGVLPDAVTYGTLIHGCVYNNKFEQAMAFVRYAYALTSGHSLLQSLAIDARLTTSVTKTGPMVRVQQDVLNTLMAAMKRKGQSLLLVELEGVAQKSGYAQVQSGQS